MAKREKTIHNIRSGALALMGLLLILMKRKYPLEIMPALLSIMIVTGTITGMPWLVAGTVNRNTVWRMLFAIIEIFSGIFLLGLPGLPLSVYRTVIALILFFYGAWFLIEAIEVRRRNRKGLTMPVSAVEAIILSVSILSSELGYFESMTPTWIGIYFLFSAVATAIALTTI